MTFKKSKLLLISIIAFGVLFSFSTSYALYTYIAKDKSFDITVDNSPNVSFAIQEAKWLTSAKEDTPGTLQPNKLQTISFKVGAKAMPYSDGTYLYDQPTVMANLDIKITSTEAFVNYFSKESTKLVGKMTYSNINSKNYYYNKEYTLNKIDATHLGLNIDVPINMSDKSANEISAVDTFTIPVLMPKDKNTYLTIADSKINMSITLSGPSEDALLQTPTLITSNPFTKPFDHQWMMAPDLMAENNITKPWRYDIPNGDVIPTKTYVHALIKDTNGTLPGGEQDKMCGPKTNAQNGKIWLIGDKKAGYFYLDSEYYLYYKA